MTVRDCIYLQTNDGRYACPVCGDVQPAPVRRNCRPRRARGCCGFVWHAAAMPVLKKLGITAEAIGQAGIGDSMAEVTRALGIQECDDCTERKRLLNELYPFPSA